MPMSQDSFNPPKNRIKVFNNLGVQIPTFQYDSLLEYGLIQVNVSYISLCTLVTKELI